MATGQTSQRLGSRLNLKMYDHDPDTTNATAVEWVAMKNYRSFMAAVMASALTGAGVTAFTINAATSSAGAGSTVVKAHAVGSAPDAVGDTLVLEVTAEQVQKVLPTATHVSAVLTMANSADENVVAYILADPVNAEENLTADVVS